MCPLWFSYSCCCYPTFNSVLLVDLWIMLDNNNKSRKTTLNTFSHSYEYFIIFTDSIKLCYSPGTAKHCKSNKQCTRKTIVVIIPTKLCHHIKNKKNYFIQILLLCATPEVTNAIRVMMSYQLLYLWRLG